MAKIFLSYRREDSRGVAGRIYDRLCGYFGRDAVFFDVDSVPPGVDFPEYIESVLSHCDVFLAVIGPDWAGQINTGRRIDNPEDWVRIEIEAALKQDLRVIPVLIDHTGMPSKADLPPSLVPLVRRNAVRVDQEQDFHHHVDRLIRGIEFHLGRAPSAAPTRDRPREAAAQAAVPQPPPPLPDRERSNSIGMTLVRIEPGSFLMGSTKEQIDHLMRLFPESKREWFDDEQPQHHVEITRPYLLGIHQVTVGQFRRFVEASHHRTEAEEGGKGSYVWDAKKRAWELDPAKNWRNPGFSQTDDHPVVCVSHNDAVAFCQWLSTKEKKEGRMYRLPGEAEWEYACRAGTNALFVISNDPEDVVKIGNVADASAKQKFPDWNCVKGNDGFVYTAPVGSLAPNAWGLYDMTGNVWEWCADWYDEKYYASSPPADPPGVAEASYRVFRGGSWCYDAWGCRPAYRSRHVPESRFYNLGFRVAAVQG